MNQRSSVDLVAPDDAAIARHLELLFGHLDGVVPLRLLGEVGTPDKEPHSHFEPLGEKLVAVVQREAARAQHTGRGVFVVPGVVVAPGRARADDVVASGVLLAATPALADRYEPQRAGHPLRIVAYVVHPIGVAIDYLILRPAHWVGEHEPFATIFGHRVD